jgi:hypothetical protein
MPWSWTCSALTLEGVRGQGSGIGLAVMRDPLPARLLTALVWPLGPIAFVLVIALLLVVATIVWPVIMLGLMAIAALGIWLL